MDHIMPQITRRDTFKGLAVGALAGMGGGWASAAERQPLSVGKPKSWPKVDVLVCGGGPAGIAAALMASRAGAKTLLVERYGRLGGMAVQAMVGPLMGHVRSMWVDEIVERVGGRRVDYEFIDLKYADMLQEVGCQILLHAWMAEPLMEGRRVVGARFITKEGPIDVKAHTTVDATGDGDVAAGAGAKFDLGRGAGPSWEADGLMQPMTIMFRVSGVKHEESMAVKGGRKRYRFPDGRTWNQLTKDAYARGELPKNVGMLRTYVSCRDEERVINATQINGVDGTKAQDLTRAELEARRQVEPIVDFLRKHAPGFQNAYVSGMPAVIGVRETRRIRGVETLVVDDLLTGKEWSNAVVHGASFGIDIHNPTGIGQAQGVSKEDPLGRDPQVKPYDIPYGCLVPQSVDGLLTAGRCISGTHEAMASYRVQVIAMGIGVAAGAAAAEAVGQAVEPRDVDVSAVQDTVFRNA